jgi:hypothetical protein
MVFTPGTGDCRRCSHPPGAMFRLFEISGQVALRRASGHCRFIPKSDGGSGPALFRTAYRIYAKTRTLGKVETGQLCCRCTDATTPKMVWRFHLETPSSRLSPVKKHHIEFLLDVKKRACQKGGSVARPSRLPFVAAAGKV